MESTLLVNPVREALTQCEQQGLTVGGPPITASKVFYMKTQNLGLLWDQIGIVLYDMDQLWHPLALILVGKHATTTWYLSKLYNDVLDTHRFHLVVAPLSMKYEPRLLQHPVVWDFQSLTSQYLV